MRGFTVALIGPDGAGKTTVARALESSMPLPVTYLYMGVNADSSNRLLPTTRLVRRVRVRPGRRLRAALRLVNALAEEWHRQLLASLRRRRGEVVLFDRHFVADYYAYDIGRGRAQPLARRLHGAALGRLYPRPDLTVYLDAPPEVLFARKGEGTLESLQRRRTEYLALADVLTRFEVVDATQPLERVVGEVGSLIEGFAAEARP